MSAEQQSYDRPSPGNCSLGDDSGTDIFYDAVEVLSLSNRLKDFGLDDGHKYAQNRGSSTFDVDSSMPEGSGVKTEPAVWTDAKIGDFLFSQIWCNAYQSMTDEEDRDSLDDQEWSDVMMENSDILCPSTSPGCDSSVGCGLPEECGHDVPDDRESMKPPVSGYPAATEADVPLLEDDPTGVNWDPPFKGWPSVSSWMSASHTIVAETDQPPPASATKDHNANSAQSQTSPVPLEESCSAVNRRDSSVLNELGAGETGTSERTALDDSILLPAQVSCLPCNPEAEDCLIPRSAGCDSNVTGIIIPFGEMATAGISVEENGFILSTFLERNEERRVLVCTIDEVVKMPEYQDISQEQQTAELESRTSSEVPVLALSRPGEDVREGEEREATGLSGHPGGLADNAFVCVEAECFSLSTAPLLNTGEDPGEDPGEAILLACKSQSKQEGDSESEEPRVYSQAENCGNTSIITASALSDGTGLLQAQGSTVSPFRRGSTNQTMKISENGLPLKDGNEKMLKGQTEKTVCSQSQEAAHDLEVFYNTSYEKGPAETHFSSLNKGVHSASVLSQEMSNMIMLTSDSQVLSKDHGVVYITLDLPETSVYDFPLGIEDVNLKMSFKKSLKKEKDENICKTEPQYSFGTPPLAMETSSGLRTLRSREADTHPVKTEETGPRTLGTGGYRTINATLPESSENLDGPISATEGILTPEPHEKMQEKQSLTPPEKKKLVKGKVLAFEEKCVPQKVAAVTKPPGPIYKKDGLGLDVRAEDGLVVGAKGEKRSAGGNGSLTTDTVSVVSEYCLTMGEVAEGTREEVKCTPLLFRQDFLCEQYFGENQPASIMTERVHFGEGMHRRAFRSRFLDGVRPVFTPGQSCVLKVHTAVTQGTQDNEELVCKNYNLAVEECSVQNTAREYIKAYREVAKAAQMFGEVPEIIPVYLVHRPTNDIPYATLEEELPGDFVKYSVRDGKEINMTRRDTEAGQKCCAFQHWVFHKTEGNLLVTDMQGVGMKLTDVGIATCRKGYKGFRGNCATSFIDQFKALHQCNKFCELLGLISLHGAQPKPRRTATELNTKTKAQPRKKTLAPSPKNAVA